MSHVGRSHDHRQLLLHNLKLIDLTRTKLRCNGSAPIIRRLTKGILSRSDLIARRGSLFFSRPLHVSVNLKFARERVVQERLGNGEKNLKCKTDLDRFKFNTVNDLIRRALCFSILFQPPSRCLFLSSFYLLLLYLLLFFSQSLFFSLSLSFSQTPTWRNTHTCALHTLALRRFSRAHAP